ncbi:MAG: hypothetical protein ABIR47_16350, partial [Candidatus Kapaibacterium sp.]
GRRSERTMKANAVDDVLQQPAKGMTGGSTAAHPNWELPGAGASWSAPIEEIGAKVAIEAAMFQGEAPISSVAHGASFLYER